MESEDKAKVTLHCYDLSGGMAKMLSQSIVGKQIDGIWHTGICVFGKEYFFGNGICCENAGQTPFGTPTTVEELGETELTIDIFHDYLNDISGRFTFMTYNLINNNCNHFTNECAGFLVDKNIPDYILKQAEEFFETPLGQSVKPMVLAQQDALIQGSSSMFGTGSGVPSHQTPSLNPSAVLSTFSNLQNPSSDSTLSPHITNMTDISALHETIMTSPNLLLYLWSPAVEQCKHPNGEIAELAEEYSAKGINFYSVNTQELVEIAFNFDIKEIPCVYIYKECDVVYTSTSFDKQGIEDELKKLSN